MRLVASSAAAVAVKESTAYPSAISLAVQRQDSTIKDQFDHPNPFISFTRHMDKPSFSFFLSLLILSHRENSCM